jgi:hypothetical protein
VAAFDQTNTLVCEAWSLASGSFLSMSIRGR